MRPKGKVGLSLTAAWGPFNHHSGGRLQLEFPCNPQLPMAAQSPLCLDVDTWLQPTLFDGNLYHSVTQWEGRRWSFVAFTSPEAARIGWQWPWERPGAPWSFPLAVSLEDTLQDEEGEL